VCCLFGLIDYKGNLTVKQKNRMIAVLSKECEIRGSDATGIAYISNDRISVYKRPLAAHKMKLFIPDATNVVMGHTRLTTQGSEKHNYNNHPFLSDQFALAHNGIISNDRLLRKTCALPNTFIETDSYIAVQLIERSGQLSFDSIKTMAEKLES
jgi:glucosamine 6-phosphate synthetase-like amidotransferase/phosphosugar isomerase protein